jgi:hypothetical protein
MAFRLAPVRLDNITKDYTKPTLVMAGTDSLAEIVDQYDRERDFRTWQQWRTETNRVFSAIAEQDYAETLPDNTTASDRQQLLLQSAALDEPLLDGLMAQKHQETDRMRDEFNQRIRALKESKRAAAAVAAATKA